MSLDAAQLQRVVKEFEHNLALSERTAAEVAVDLSWTPERVQCTMQLASGSDPVDVWQLRDYLHAAVKAAGRRPSFTVLSSRNRLRAALWFGLRPVPRVTTTRP
ncbi:MAG: DUF2316 family protein [Microbacteriaceae bacterium]|nr:MAG: DUF2316 family protein [Microbacteriaceae bacterium]